MKILHVLGYHPEIGGPYNVVRHLARHLRSKGCDISVLTPRYVTYSYDSMLNDEKIFEKISFADVNPLASRIWTSYSHQYLYLQNWINGFDIIHVHGIFDYYAYVIAVKACKPFVITPHGSLLPELITSPFSIKKNVYMYTIGRKILARAAKIHALTAIEKNSICQYVKNTDKIHIIPNGVDPFDLTIHGDPEDIVPELRKLSNRQLILFLGRINWKKGLDDLIPAFRLVVNVISDAHLLLVGPDYDGYMGKVNRWIHEYHLESYVTYIGPRYDEQKTAILNKAKTFVLPTYSEAIPVAILEAMYSGLPIVTTAQSGISQEIQRVNAGIIVQKKPASIAAAIVELLRNPSKSDSYGNAGHRFIVNGWLWDNISNRILDLYEHAISVK